MNAVYVCVCAALHMQSTNIFFKYKVLASSRLVVDTTRNGKKNNAASAAPIGTVVRRRNERPFCVWCVSAGGLLCGTCVWALGTLYPDPSVCALHRHMRTKYI